MRPGAGRYIYIYICKQVRLHGYPGGVFVGHRPPGTRVAPCKMIYKKVEVLHLFRWYTHTHKQAHNGPDTHTVRTVHTHTHIYTHIHRHTHAQTDFLVVLPCFSSLLVPHYCFLRDAFLGRRYRVGLSGPIILNINTHFALPCFACVVLVLLGVADSKCF